MSVMEIVFLVVISIVCGVLGQWLSGVRVGGFIASAVVGFVGAWLGKWLAAKLELGYLLPVTIDGKAFPIVWAVVGAALLTFVVGFVMKKKKR